MPFTLDYTDPDTNANFPTSFWVISHLYLDHLHLNGQITFRAYTSVTDYNDGLAHIAEKSFKFNNPDDYAALVEFQFESISEIFSFYSLLESAVLSVSDFFALATQTSVYRVLTAEIGEEADNKINIQFSGRQVTGVQTDNVIVTQLRPTLLGGNISYTVTDADLVIGHSDQAYYVLDADALSSWPIRWNFRPELSDMYDAQLIPFHTLMFNPITSTVGCRAKFDVVSNSMHAGGTC
jgi:hypothetical protein